MKSTPVPLLNPASDALVARKLLTLAQRRLATLEATLTTSVLERDAYLQTIGARLELARLCDEMHHTYEKETRS